MGCIIRQMTTWIGLKLLRKNWNVLNIPSAWDGSGFETSIWRVKVSPDQRILGYLCEKTILRAKCATNYFFVSSYNKEEIPSKITASECMDSIKDYSHGLSKMHSYPDTSCSWGKNVVIDTIRFTVSPMLVGYDPYRLGIVHPTLYKGFCTAPPCETNRDNVNFYFDPELTHECNHTSHMIRSVAKISVSDDSNSSICQTDGAVMPKWKGTHSAISELKPYGRGGRKRIPRMQRLSDGRCCQRWTIGA